MGKNYSISIYIILISIASIFSEVAHGQIKIKWEEIPNLAQKINAEVPEGKALLVFEAKEDFIFDSDNENIIQPIKDGLLYKLMIDIEPSSGAITIQHEGADNSFINYGKTINSASLPALKSKEVKYFRLNLTTPLSWFDITRQKIKEGATDFQALYDKEALVIFYVVPQNLDLIIEGSEITNTIHEEGRYKIYTKPGVQKIIIKSKNYDDTSIDFEDLVSKDVRYYHIGIPQLNVDVESFDPNTKVGNYSIESVPAGALIQMTGRPDFNNSGYKTPYTLEGYKAGTEIITLNLNRFETITDTILISSTRGKKSKYTLTPTFAYINCNIEPSIPISKVLMDGKELTSIENDKNVECPKGTHNIEISAPHYYSETRQISLAAGKTSEVNVKLKPKMGYLTVLPGENAVNAEVYINDQNIGKLPIQNFQLQEGEYNLRVERKSFGTFTNNKKPITITENKNSTLTADLESTKEVLINTEPDGAIVYIDGEKQKDETRLKILVPIGKHTIRFERKNYKALETILEVTENLLIGKEFKYILLLDDYPVTLNSKPIGAVVYADGKVIGTTPLITQLPYGQYNIEYARHNYLNKIKKISVGSPENSKFSVKLFPSNNFTLIGAGYGLNTYSIGLGWVLERIYIQGMLNFIKDYTFDKSTYFYTDNAKVDDLGMYAEPVGKITYKDSAEVGINIKLGYLFQKPIPFILTAGYVGSKTAAYKKIYKAHHDYVSSDGTTILKDSNFSSNKYYKDAFNGFSIGVVVPIAKWFYLSADYYSASEAGAGLYFGAGLMYVFGTFITSK